MVVGWNERLANSSESGASVGTLARLDKIEHDRKFREARHVSYPFHLYILGSFWHRINIISWEISSKDNLKRKNTAHSIGKVHPTAIPFNIPVTI